MIVMDRPQLSILILIMIHSRPITRGFDVLYPGTCEADAICYTSIDNSSVSKGRSCVEGFVCDQKQVHREK